MWSVAHEFISHKLKEIDSSTKIPALTSIRHCRITVSYFEEMLKVLMAKSDY